MVENLPLIQNSPSSAASQRHLRRDLRTPIKFVSVYCEGQHGDCAHAVPFQTTRRFSLGRSRRSSLRGMQKASCPCTGQANALSFRPQACVQAMFVPLLQSKIPGGDPSCDALFRTRTATVWTHRLSPATALLNRTRDGGRADGSNHAKG